MVDMKTFRSILVAVAVATLATLVRAAADEPQNFTYDPKPTGQMVDSKIVYMAGESMHSQWRAVTSKKLVGTNSGTNFYQWYLSIYAIEDTTYKLFYQSPANGGPLEKVEKAGPMWFPLQSVQVVGAADLMESDKPQVEQLVVTSHEAGADCGATTVTVFTEDAGKVHPAVSLLNSCSLTATIKLSDRSNSDAPDTLALTGPYYGPNAALCCPTKPKVTAVLSYKNGHWIQTPEYFSMFLGKFPSLR